MNKVFIIFPIIFLIVFTVFSQNPDSLKIKLLTANDSSRIGILRNLGHAYRIDKQDSSELLLDSALVLAKKLDNIDGIIGSLKDLASLYENKDNPEKVIEYYNQALKFAKENFSKKEEVDIYLKKGSYLSQRLSFHDALNSFQRALNICKRLGFQKELSVAFSKIGDLLSDQGQYVESLESYLKAIEVDESMNDSLGIASNLNNIALIYKKQDDISKALEYYNKALVIFGELEDRLSLALTKINIALIYKDQDKFDMALKLFTEARDIFGKDTEPCTIANLNHNTGVVYFQMGDYKASLDYLNTAQQLAEKYGFQKTKAKNFKEIAEVYNAMKNFDLAVFNAKKSLSIATKLNSPEEFKEANKVLYKIYKNQKNYRKAIIHYQNYHKTKDSLFSIDKSRQIIQLQTQYQLKEKEKEIAVLEKENDMQQLNAKNKKIINYGLAGGVVLLLTFIIIILISYKNKVKANKILQVQKAEINAKNEEINAQKEALLLKNKKLEDLNKETNEIMNIVAHDLRSPLNQVKGLLNILATTIPLDKEGENYFNMINSSTDRLRGMINKMLDIRAIESNNINLNNEVLDMSELSKYVTNNFTEIAKEKSITLMTNTDDDCYIHADKNYLIQVFENLISNAIKFSMPNKEVEISVYKQNDKVLAKITDQGPGFNDSDKKKLFKKFQKLSARPTNSEESTGLGLAIVKKYVTAMNGKVWCESNEGKGASFIIELPYTNEGKINLSKGTPVVMPSDTLEQ